VRRERSVLLRLSLPFRLFQRLSSLRILALPFRLLL
jgi:hypothetical protein